MCKVLQVSRSGYYKWRSAQPSKQQMQRIELTKGILYHYHDSNGLYGSPKITALLRREGFCVSEKTVGRIMREQGLRSRTVKKFRVRTTDSNHDFAVAPNLLNQQFEASSPNEVWVADITYVRTRQGMLYLASIMDLFTRKIVGWALGDRMTVALVAEAFQSACTQYSPPPGLVHHSDRGSQYAAHEYRAMLREYGMICSMSRKANCYDNACMESFFSIIKRELVYQVQFETKDEARQQIYRYIEFFYNRKRIHSALDYMSPDRFEEAYIRRQLAA